LDTAKHFRKKLESEIDYDANGNLLGFKNMMKNQQKIQKEDNYKKDSSGHYEY